jgi:lipoic acid synthetase
VVGKVGDIFGARYLAGTGIEILTGDFKGDEPSIIAVAQARPDVFAHNVETTPRLQKVARHKATWERSLRVLQIAQQAAAEIGHTMFIKTGMMLGLGEDDAEVREAMQLLRESGVELLTLGQYLKPRNVSGKLDMSRWVTPDEFAALAEFGRSLGFAGVAASPLTRSSYLAETLYAQALARRAGGPA